MGETDENLLKVVRHCQESLDKYTTNRNDGKLLHYLQKLYKLPIKVAHLEETGVGRTVNGLRKLGGDVGDSAKGLVAKWKAMVVGEQQEEENEDEEDGYQTGEDESESEEEDTSSHKKSDNHSTDDRRSKARESSKSERRSSEKSPKKEERHKRTHSEHKSRKHESDTSSEEEPPRKHHKKEDDKHRSRSEEHRQKSKKLADTDDSEEEVRSPEKKHKSDKHKLEKKKSKEVPLETEDVPKSSKSKEKYKESSSKDKSKHKSSRKDDSKKHGSKTKDGERKNKEKEKEKLKNKSEDKAPKTKNVNGHLIIEGVGSGSGASFAEALGMCGPSSSKSSAKKKPLEKKEKPAKVEDAVPKLLKEPAVEPPLDLNLSSLLPQITPNYRPLGNLMCSDAQTKKFVSESEALASIITSKNLRTKVYSGNKTGNSTVPSLFDLCIRILQDNIDALEYTGGVPYNVLKPILDKANPNQLFMMEHHNPYLIEDTDELWALHCHKEFRNKQRQEMETWRDMYMRCLDERDARLRALTANIKQSQDKSLPVRMTKMAYIDAVAKPPRNIARKQAKNGTAFDIRKPLVTPSARLSTLATAGEAGKVSVPNPGSRAVDRPSGHAAKSKKAPLMLKSITSFKNRFKR